MKRAQSGADSLLEGVGGRGALFLVPTSAGFKVTAASQGVGGWEGGGEGGGGRRCCIEAESKAYTVW